MRAEKYQKSNADSRGVNIGGRVKRYLLGFRKMTHDLSLI